MMNPSGVPGPAPLRRAPVELIFVAVVVRSWGIVGSLSSSTWRGGLRIFTICRVSRRQRVGSGFARELQQSRLCCLAAPSDAFAPRRSLRRQILAIMEARETLRATFAAGQPRVLYAHQLMAKKAALEAFHCRSCLYVRPAARRFSSAASSGVRASATTH